MKTTLFFAAFLATAAVILAQGRYRIRYPSEIASDKGYSDVKSWQSTRHPESRTSKTDYDKIASENEIDSDETYETSKEEQSTTENPKPNEPSTFSRILNSVLQVPVSLFRSIGSFFSSAPLTRLRDEMQKLNISYPKSK